MTVLLLLFLLFQDLQPSVARAEELTESAQSIVEPEPAEPVRKKKGKRTSEKEAEGTKAANRFEADTVIKSQYQYNGEHLEVDPD